MNNIVHIQHQFGDYLLNFIKSKVTSTDDAKDIYQEVILKIMNKSGQLKKAQSLKSWLFTIAKNQIIDFYRKRNHEVDLDLVSAHSEEDVLYAELENCLSGFIEQLPEDYKTLIMLSEIEGRSQKELSESLGINYVTLRSKVQRGRDKIKKMIFDACVVHQDTSGRLVECLPKSTSAACGNADGGCS